MNENAVKIFLTYFLSENMVEKEFKFTLIDIVIIYTYSILNLIKFKLINYLFYLLRHP